MTPGFAQPYPSFACPTLDGQNFALNGPLFFFDEDGTLWCAPERATTDGPSIPQINLSAVSPFGADIWGPSILHDAGFRGFLLRWDVQRMLFAPAQLDEAQTNDLFDRAMRICGANHLRREVVFQAVHLFGAPAFESDLSLSLPKIKIPKILPPEILVALGFANS